MASNESIRNPRANSASSQTLRGVHFAPRAAVVLLAAGLSPGFLFFVAQGPLLSVRVSGTQQDGGLFFLLLDRLWQRHHESRVLALRVAAACRCTSISVSWPTPPSASHFPSHKDRLPISPDGTRFVAAKMRHKAAVSVSNSYPSTNIRFIRKDCHAHSATSSSP
jgi:hypothetical protein